MLSTGKIAEVLFEKTLEIMEAQQMLLSLTMFEQPDGATQQNASNFVWRPVQQHAPIIDGWDLTGLETGIIEETYPSILGTPKNDFVSQRADDLRTLRFWEDRASASAIRQAAELNKNIANAIATQGSLFVRSNVASGFDFLAAAQVAMNERQSNKTTRNFLLNDRDTMKFAQDLAGRQTLQGRPETTWATGQIGNNIAEFDVHTGSFLPNLAGGASPGSTVTGAQTFAPSGGTVDSTTGIVTNVDYRTANIPVNTSVGYNIGDKVNIGAVQSVGLMDKTPTNQLMTFTIVGIPDGTTLTVYPKPIAVVDAALTTLEKAYANTDVVIPNAAVVTRLNTAASEKTNLFWDKSAIEVQGGNIPANLFQDYDGMKSMSDTMVNGQVLYMVYDGNIETMSFRYRLFTWYGITVANPQGCGVALSY